MVRAINTLGGIARWARSQIMTLQLYHNPMSRAVIIHALLEELGAPYELKRVEYDDGSMRTPEFLALNPMGKIPTLVDGEVAVSETPAIAIYLADKYKDPHDLAPAFDDPRRGEYLRWVVFQGTGIDGAMAHAGGKFEISRQQAGWGSPELVAEVLTQRLGKADPFVFGDWFTAADVMLATSVGWALRFNLFPKTPELEGYVGRVMARPAMQRVFAAPEHAG